MKPEVGRRVFVGSVVAGLPLLAGKAGLLAQGAGVAHDHVTAPTIDPVVDHIVRQIAGIHNAAQSGLRGEHARALATQLRTLIVYERQIGVDDQVRTALRSLVEREGRDTILYAEPDPEMRRKTMKEYGFRPEERVVDFPIALTHAAREAALDALLRGGVTPVFERIATTADRVAMRLDRSSGRVVAIAQDTDWWVGFCSELWNEYQQAQSMATPFCLLAKYFTFAMPSCAAMEGGAMVLFLAYLYECMAYH